MNVQQWQVLKHTAYSPHSLPCNFCIFGQPKKALKGSTFTANDDKQETAVQQQHKGLHIDELRQLIHQWDCCHNAYAQFF
jgi:hypothetical protein